MSEPALPVGRSLVARSGRLLPAIAIVVFALVTLAVVASSVVAGTLGFDFLAYHAAAARVLDGQPLYDMSYATAGGFGLFYYPPTFAPLILPVGFLPAGLAVWLWTGLLVGAVVLAVWLMPVPAITRWVVFLLAGLSWPVAYSIKLGQVGPLLLLAFVAGWRWIADGGRLGASAALGAAIKIQPGLVFAWALATRRWVAVAMGAVVLGALAVIATVLAGTSVWSDFLVLVLRVGDPITTAHNATPGAIAWQLGAAREVASVIQLASTAGALVVVLGAAFRLRAVPGYLVAVVASQLVSPILWDHYAIVLLVPVAWLLATGHRWAALIPLATSLPLLPIVQPWLYPTLLWATVLVLFAVDTRQSTVTATESARLAS